MTASTATVADLSWMVTLLATRRDPLVQHAPVFWRSATDASAQHHAFLEFLLSEGGAKAYRTDASLLVAFPRGDGWLVDDAYVPGEHWATGDGRELWEAFADDCRGEEVRFVCPTYEHDRAEFALAAGLRIAESWWLMELTSSGGEAGLHLQLPGADAITVGAPPVYAPPGPILFLPAPSDAGAALPAAIDTASEIGCAAIVVNQRAGDNDLATTLRRAGFRQHCDYYTGTIDSI